MPPDSTSFLETLFDPQQWAPITIFTAIAAIAAVGSAIFAFWPLWKQWRTQRLLERCFGSEFYGPIR